MYLTKRKVENSMAMLNKRHGINTEKSIIGIQESLHTHVPFFSNLPIYSYFLHKKMHHQYLKKYLISRMDTKSSIMQLQLFHFFESLIVQCRWRKMYTAGCRQFSSKKYKAIASSVCLLSSLKTFIACTQGKIK